MSPVLQVLPHNADIAAPLRSPPLRRISITSSSQAPEEPDPSPTRSDVADAALPLSPPGSMRNAAAGKRRRSFNTSYRRYLSANNPPTSVTEFAERKSYFSVTDLVGPTWCEASWRYGILGLNVLPVDQRPTEIRLPSGKVIVPDRQTAVRKQQIQDKGTEVHRKLEEEIHPERVEVRTTTEADEWALRLLRIVVGLRSLIDVGCVRELPIFGFVRGNLVMGVIDEIGKKESPPDLFGVKVLDLGGQGTASPFGNPIDAPRFWGFFLTDNKTRVRHSVPALSDQRAARLQTMLYKRLFDGLCLGSLQRMRAPPPGERPSPAPAGQQSASIPPGLDSDSAAQPLDLPRLWSSLALSNDDALSDAFREDAQALLADDELAGSQPMQHTAAEIITHTLSSSTATLGDVVRLLDETMLELLDSAWRGAGASPNSEAQQGHVATTALRKELSLVYWPQVKGKQARKGNKSKGRVVPAISEDASRKSLAPSDGPDAGPLELKSEDGATDIEDEKEVDAQLGPATATYSNPDLAEVQSAPPPQTQDNVQSPVSTARDGIIGRVTFRHAPGWLSAHLDSVLALWSGERSPRGVSEAESWKCRGCEFREGCEWRDERAEEKAQWALRRQEAREAARRRERKQEVLDGQAGAEAGDMADVSNLDLEDLVIQDASNDGDGDAELWAEFAEIQDIEDSAPAGTGRHVDPDPPSALSEEALEAAKTAAKGKRKRKSSRKAAQGNDNANANANANADAVEVENEEPARGRFVRKKEKEKEGRYGLRPRGLPNQGGEGGA